MGIVPYLTEMIRQEGFSVGVFTGKDKLATASDSRNMLHQFIEAEKFLFLCRFARSFSLLRIRGAN